MPIIIGVFAAVNKVTTERKYIESNPVWWEAEININLFF